MLRLHLNLLLHRNEKKPTQELSLENLQSLHPSPGWNSHSSLFLCVKLHSQFVYQMRMWFLD